MCPQTQAALVKRDAPAATPLQDLEKHAVEFQKTISEQFNALANSKNTQDLNKAFKDGSDTVLQQLSAFSSSLQSAVSTVHVYLLCPLELSLSVSAECPRGNSRRDYGAVNFHHSRCTRHYRVKTLI